MSSTAETATSAQPSPQRHRANPGALLFGLLGGPAGWVLQLVVNYAVASYICYPHATPRLDAPIHAGVWPILLGVNGVGMLLALGAAFVSWRIWRKTRREQAGSTGHLLEVGEGRTRFLAMVGTMAGIGFLAAGAFDTVMLFVVPLCPG